MMDMMADLPFLRIPEGGRLYSVESWDPHASIRVRPRHDQGKRKERKDTSTTEIHRKRPVQFLEAGSVAGMLIGRQAGMSASLDMLLLCSPGARQDRTPDRTRLHD